MKLLKILICLALIMGCVPQLSHAENHLLKQQLMELESLIDEQPPFLFKDYIHGKLFIKEGLKEAILLAEENKLEEARGIIQHLLAEIAGALAITDPILKDSVCQKLMEILRDPPPQS